MAREIYNKNAREKVLLEQAYTSIYNEEISGDFKLSGQFHPSMEQGIRKHIMNLVNYVTDNNIKVVSYMDRPTIAALRDAMKKVAPTMVSWFITEYGMSNVARDVISAMGNVEDYESEEGNTLEDILPTLEFKETTKQAKKYEYAKSSQNMPAMSYTVVQQQQPVVTVTSDGKETQNTAEPNDIIMSGPSREQYVVKPEKFIGERGLYTGKVGGTVTPEQSPRIVARVENITQDITFKAPWGEDMILKRGDYLVKDGDQGYYRIAQKEYDETYNPI